MTDRLPHQADGWAFFLDFDGTLIDIAPQPDAVVVPENLAALLSAVAAAAGGSLAVVSGRSIATIDRLLQPARLPVAGVHGAEIRFPDGETLELAAPPALDGVRDTLRMFSERHPGTRLEDKELALSLHYRGAPRDEAAAIEAIEAAATAMAGAFVVQRGKMVVELRPAGADKGRALSSFMARAPFRDRRPIAVGDDLTDEHMFVIAKQMGGIAARVGKTASTSAATEHFDDSAAVRRWLAALV